MGNLGIGVQCARPAHHTISTAASACPISRSSAGLSKELVVAPYATLLAMMVEPRQALRNLAIAGSGRSARAVRFPRRDRLHAARPGLEKAVVCTYMAHHIGMSIVALDNALNRQVWQRRFHTDPLVRSAELVLQERIPRRLVMQDVPAQTMRRSVPSETEKPAVREIDTPHTPQPRVAILGNVPYTTMITQRRRRLQPVRRSRGHALAARLERGTTTASGVT